MPYKTISEPDDLSNKKNFHFLLYFTHKILQAILWIN